MSAAGAAGAAGSDAGSVAGTRAVSLPIGVVAGAAPAMYEAASRLLHALR